MTEIELWNQYCETCHIDKATPYQAWRFGDDPNTLAELVYQGKKTATSSLFDLYELNHEPLPEAGDISIILNHHDEAICIIRNTKVYLIKYGDVSEEYAHKEGEGDRSLSYWRKIHSEFFHKEADQSGLSFDESSIVVCEEFEVIYKR